MARARREETPEDAMRSWAEWQLRRNRSWFECFLRRIVREELAALIPPPQEKVIEWAYVYALCDPDTGAIRYIGKANDPEDRFAQHIYTSVFQQKWEFELTTKEWWIRELHRTGKRPELRVLEKVEREMVRDAENRWYRWAVEQGCELTNSVTP